MLRLSLLLAVLVPVCWEMGCTSYIVPSGRANLSGITGASMQESFAAKPAAVLPANIATVRVQAPRYRSYYTEREGGVYGHGRFSVVMVKEVEQEADLQRLAHLPQVGGLITLSTLLLPENLESDKDLREAAARLKADMVLLYTFDTSFHDNDASVALNVITLGLSPTRHIYVHVAASALLIDTRTGFIYAALEANEKRQTQTNAWESSESADRARREAEQVAFKALVSEFEQSWPTILARVQQGE